MALTVVDRHAFMDKLGKGRPIVADFYADWCRPCRAIAPALDSLQAEHGEQVDFVKVDVDAEPMLAADLGVQAMPTVIHFDAGGKEVGRVVGVARVDEIAHALGLHAQPATT